jgi:hypothetical protein
LEHRGERVSLRRTLWFAQGRRVWKQSTESPDEREGFDPELLVFSPERSDRASSGASSPTAPRRPWYAFVPDYETARFQANALAQTGVIPGEASVHPEFNGVVYRVEGFWPETDEVKPRVSDATSRQHPVEPYPAGRADSHLRLQPRGMRALRRAALRVVRLCWLLLGFPVNALRLLFALGHTSRHPVSTSHARVQRPGGPDCPTIDRGPRSVSQLAERINGGAHDTEAL